jgi:hypothetical protein
MAVRYVGARRTTLLIAPYPGLQVLRTSEVIVNQMKSLLPRFPGGDDPLYGPRQHGGRLELR